MKKTALTLVFFILTRVAFSNWYYQPYPISAQITSTGSQWRIECTVYDSILSSVQTYNSPYYNTQLSLFLPTGIALFISDDNANIPNNYSGAIIYDMELHQFIPLLDSCIGCFDGNYNISSTGSIVDFRRSDLFNPGYEDYKNAYYDIKNASWKIGANCNFYYANSIASNYGFVVNSEGDPDGDYDVFYMNPRTHQWVTAISGWTPGNIPYPNMVDDFVFFDGFDPSTPGNYANFHTIGPNTGQSDGFSDGDYFGHGYGIIHWLDNFSGLTEIRAFDAQTDGYASLSLSDCNSAALQKDNFMFCIPSTSGNIINYGVYSITQHAWVTSADTFPSPVVSLALNNQTVTIDNGGGNIVIRGYNDSTGWGNFTTPPQPLFFLGNYASATEGNLIYVKDYSIATTPTLFDFGDGITTTKKSGFHLYKVNGLYRMSSAANFNVCLYTTGAGSTLSTCKQLSFPTLIETIVNPTSEIKISKTRAGIFEVSNNSGGITAVKVYNALGQSLFSTQNTSALTVINIKNFSEGIYIIHATDVKSGGITTQKVWKD